MDWNGTHIGFALTGSFCTFARVFRQMKTLAETGAEIVPILSFQSYALDTRFFLAAEVRRIVQETTGREALHTLEGVEPIGPKKLLDLLIVAPCTGNTLAKLAMGIADTPVLLAAKSHLRNGRPLLLAVSTNDGLGNAAKNIGQLLNMKQVYFVPFGQDDPQEKPNSLVAHMEEIPAAAEAALACKQLQPVIRGY